MPNLDYASAKNVNFDKIPVIDLSEIDSEQGFAQVAEQLVTTARKVGFFYISGHAIDPEIADRAFAAAQRFFALPVDQKSRVAVNQHQRGWMGQGMAQLEGANTHDAKEVFFWGWDVAENDPDVCAQKPMVFPNQWPDEVAPDLKLDLLPYYEAVVALSRKLLGALAVGLGQRRDFFDLAYAKPLARGQLVYYPPLHQHDQQAQRFGAAAHTDFGVLTILRQDMLGGLQVKNAAGQWIEAPPIDNTLVCNIGDLLQRWTNGYLTSTVHRVINRASTARYSIPIFCDPASETRIDPQDFTDRACDYSVTTAGAYIQARNRKNFSQYK